jgi:hypothetical protein
MKKIIVLVFVLLLTGCSTKFAYNNLSWLIYWYLDDYVELNNTQEDMFDDMLSNWMKWHRDNELPKYQLQLEDIIADIKNNNINEQSIIEHRERARAHWVRARAHVAPDVVKLGATLSQDQLVYLFANLEKENVEDEQEMQEERQLSQQERIEKWIKRNQKGIKRWFGKLSDEQENFIGTFYDRFESTRPHWLSYKRSSQQNLRQTFAMTDRGELFEQKLHDLVVDPEQFRSAEFVMAMEKNLLASTQYTMGLLDLASEKQVKILIDEIDELKNDVVSLRK